MENGLPHWNNGVHQDGGYWLGPWPSGTLRGTLGGRISTLLAGLLEHSWCTAVHSAQSKSPWFHGFQNCQSMVSFIGSSPPLPFAPIWNPCWRLPGNSLTRLYGGAIPPPTLNGGGSSVVTLEVVSNGDGGSTQLGKLCHHLDQGKGPGTTGVEEGGGCRAGSCWRGHTPEGMLSRVDVGAFPSSRWKGVTIIPQASWGLALRAVLQVVRKARQSLFSSSLASASRRWMSLACDCWIEWAWVTLWDSASLIAVDQQFSASAKVCAQLASASLIQAVCWTLALLISTTWWASTSLMVQAQRAFTSLMASVTSDSFWQRAIPKSETCFLW